VRAWRFHILSRLKLCQPGIGFSGRHVLTGLLGSQGDSADCSRREFDLQLALSRSLLILNSLASKRGPGQMRAQELCEQIGDDADHPEVLLQLAHFRFVQREYDAA
jgi:hypothetical protein